MNRYEASDFVINYSGGRRLGEDGEVGSGNQGSSIIIQSPPSDRNGVAITNRGQILAGNGADFGGDGGSVSLLGNYVDISWNGIIRAGHGGDMIEVGFGGDGGDIIMNSSGFLRMRGLIIAGNGGDNLIGWPGGGNDRWLESA